MKTNDVIENGEVVEKGTTQMIINPDWSLGTYSRSLVVRAGGDPHNQSATILKVIDYFENGQHCDETGSGRKTAVHLMCCSREALGKLTIQAPPPPNPNGNNHNAPHTPPPPPPPSPKDLYESAMGLILSITEPEVCSYEMMVCVQNLCDPDSIEKEDASQSNNITHPFVIYIFYHSKYGLT